MGKPSQKEHDGGPLNMTGQLAMFAPAPYVFMRDLRTGQSFAIGTPEHHSAPFRVVGNRERSMTVEFVNRHGEQRQSRWNYEMNDLCLVVEGGA